MSAFGKRVVTAIFGAVIMFAMAAAPAAAAPSWLEPVDLLTPKSSAEEPQVVIEDGGTVVAIWRSRVTGEDDFIEAAKKPAGGEWSAPMRLSSSAGDADEPQLAVDSNGYAIAIWRGESGAGSDTVQVAKSIPGSGWGPVRELSEPGSDATQPQIAVNSAGNAMAVWERSDGVEDRIQASYRPASGVWEDPVYISDASGRSTNPHVGIDAAGNATVTWEQTDGTEYRLRAARRLASGAWGAPVTVSDPGRDADTSQVAVDANGSVVAVWQRYDGDDNRIQAAVRSRDGDWEPAVYISDPGEEAYDPQVASAPDGSVIAVWYRSDGTSYRVQAASKPAGGDWKAPVNLSAAGYMGEYPQLAIDASGNATVVWRSFGPDDSDFRTQAARKTLGGIWGPPVTLSHGGEDSEEAQVAGDAEGNAVSVWRRDVGSDEVIQAAAFDGAGPRLLSLVIPAGGEVDTPLAFSVAPLDVISSLGATSWSFGDGSGAVGESVSHAFEKPGDYAVTVKAADGLGNETSVTRTVTIAAKPTVPPVADPKGGPKPPMRARANRRVKVKRGVAVLRLRCPAAGPCRGLARLSVAVKQKRKRKLMTIGRKRIALAAGRRANVRIKLNRRGRMLLRKAAKRKRPLRATLAGGAVKRRGVVLRQLR